MNIDEFNTKLKTALEAVADSLPTIVDERSLNAIAMLKERFIQKGLLADKTGSLVAFPAYSEKYAEFKEKKQGASTPNRLVLSGHTLRKLEIINRQQADNIYTATVGGGDTESENRLSWNADRYGDVLQLSTDEVKQLVDFAEEDILNIFIKELE